MVQGALPLQLLPESSAGSADAAAVLADWGRPSSAIDSSTAHALRTAHARGLSRKQIRFEAIVIGRLIMERFHQLHTRVVHRVLMALQQSAGKHLKSLEL